MCFLPGSSGHTIATSRSHIQAVIMAIKWLTGALVVKGVSLLVPVWLVLAPWKRWKLRKIPGPFAWPLLGNLPQVVAAGDALMYERDMVAKHGKVFKVWLGTTVNVMISDPAVLRKLLLHCVTRPNRDMFIAIVGEPYHAHRWNMLWMSGKDPKFRTFRKMFDHTLLNPGSLAAHAGVLNEVGARLARHLSSFATSGEAFDASILCADMAMEAIGFAAFGLDLDCQGQAAHGISLAEAAANSHGGVPQNRTPSTAADKPRRNNTNGVHAEPVKQPPKRVRGSSWLSYPLGSPEFSEGLVRSSRDMFLNCDLTNTTRWAILTLLFPDLCRPISWIANLIGTKRLRRDRETRQDLVNALRLMIQEWNQSKQGGGTSGAIAMSDRGFLPQLLSNLPAGQDGVCEMDLIAQAFLMLLAGYESTSSALAISLHLLSTHPDIQQRAQQEVDTVLQGKEAGPDDLERLPFIRAVFDETLRLYPIASAVVMRELASTEEIEVDGKTHKLPAGTAFVANAYQMQRDPAYWPCPDEFLPQRHVQPGNEELAATVSAAYLPFGHGPRMCPGYKFAQLEGRLALAKLMQQYTFKPAPGCPPPKFKSGIVYIPDHVWLTAEARK